MACAVCALLAKISRIRDDLSMIFTLNSSSRIFVCFPVRSSSKMASSISLASMNSLISSAFPFPMKVLLSGWGSFWINRSIVLAPAVSARNSASPPDRYLFPVDQAERGCAASPALTRLSLEPISDVRFTPRSGHPERRNRCPLSARSGRSS